MNERIKLLAEQAGQYVNNAMDERANNKYFTFGDIDEMYNTKFAELIVRECADLFDKDEIELTLTERTIHNTIKEHFGVKE